MVTFCQYLSPLCELQFSALLLLSIPRSSCSNKTVDILIDECNLTTHLLSASDNIYAPSIPEIKLWTSTRDINCWTCGIKDDFPSVPTLMIWARKILSQNSIWICLSGICLTRSDICNLHIRVVCGANEERIGQWIGTGRKHLTNRYRVCPKTEF